VCVLCVGVFLFVYSNVFPRSCDCARMIDSLDFCVSFCLCEFNVANETSFCVEGRGGGRRKYQAFSLQTPKQNTFLLQKSLNS